MDRDSLYQEAQLLTQTNTASNGGNEHGLDDQVTDRTMDRTTSTSVGSQPKAFPWELIPSEMRRLIFELVDTPIQQEWFVLPPVLPSLLVALRRLSVSYNHAVQHFQKRNKLLDMDAYSRHPALHVTRTELLVVESVRLDVGHPICLKRKQLQKRGVAEDYSTDSWVPTGRYIV